MHGSAGNCVIVLVIHGSSIGNCITAHKQNLNIGRPRVRADLLYSILLKFNESNACQRKVVPEHHCICQCVLIGRSYSRVSCCI
jgi:hypothetical protein